jgi:hypothetical protein
MAVTEESPVLIGPIENVGAAELLAACHLLNTRGSGSQAWTLWYRHDPVAFLLDAMDEAVTLWVARENQCFVIGQPKSWMWPGAGIRPRNRFSMATESWSAAASDLP